MKYLPALMAVLTAAACTDDSEAHDHDPEEDAALFEQAHDENRLEPKSDGPDCSGVDCVASQSCRPSRSRIAQPKSSDSRMIDE